MRINNLTISEIIYCQGCNRACDLSLIINGLQYPVIIKDGQFKVLSVSIDVKTMVVTKPSGLVKTSYITSTCDYCNSHIKTNSFNMENLILVRGKHYLKALNIVLGEIHYKKSRVIIENGRIDVDTGFGPIYVSDGSETMTLDQMIELSSRSSIFS